MKKNLLFAAVAALVLVGCNDRDQSELTEEALNLTGKANIKATFYYNPGTRIVDGVEVSELLPIPNDVEVFAKVDYAQYTGADAGKSFKQIKAKSLGNGEFEISIPAGEKQIKVTVVANGFYADYWISPDKNAINAYFPKLELTEFSVLAGQAFVKDDKTETTFEKPTDLLNNDRTKVFNVSGKLEGVKEIWDNEAFAPKGDMQGLGGIELELEIKAADASKDSRSLTFKATTAADGTYAFKDILLYDEWVEELEGDAAYLDTKISAKPWVDREFTHFYKTAEGSSSKIVFDQATIGDEGSWNDATIDGLFYLNDDSKPVFLYQWSPGKNVKVIGAWEVTSIAVANLQANVTLYGEAINQDLTATFTPKDVNSVLGVGSNGKTNTARNKADESVRIPETTINNILGW